MSQFFTRGGWSDLRISRYLISICSSLYTYLLFVCVPVMTFGSGSGVDLTFT